VDSLSTIDPNLHLVWHEYRTLTENFLSAYEGPVADPRFTIHHAHGHLNFGYVLQPDGVPVKEQRWHIWWLRRPHGWCHVLDIEDQSPKHLEKILDVLLHQARFLDSRRARDYFRLLQEKEAQAQAKSLDTEKNTFSDITRENRPLIRRALEEAARGNVDPTNPHKDVIVSYAGQGNKSKLIVPVSEREGGLYTGE
jgi:hypothetical protein